MLRSRTATAVTAWMTAALLAAGCSTPAAAPSPSTAGSAGTVASSASSDVGSSAGAAVATGSDTPTGTTGSAAPDQASSNPGITVVAPPLNPSADTPATRSSPGAVTTTVTVPPTSARSRTPKRAHTSTPARTTKRTRPTHASTPAPRTTSTHTSTRTTPPPTTSATPTTHTSAAAGHGSLAGKVVVIDPGHNGANHLHPEIINKQVPAGFGEYKNCNTTGTETNAGYPEYRFNWKVALALRDALRAKGITVVMTRDSDDGVGPCVNKRAAIGNDAKADAVVSIHGDGESASIKGFYVMTASRPPAGQQVASLSDKLAADIRDGLQDANFPVSNALGQDGLWTRSDLAGLNLSMRPTVMIECGNMRNATEAALMSSSSGQRRYADGIAAGVISYLGG